jgi:hypothetical protein
MVVSRDWQEVGVLECILGGLHIGVNVESELERAQSRLQKSKVDALIVDCDLGGTSRFLHGLHGLKTPSSVPLLIVSGSTSRRSLESTGASFVFEKPISVEQAVHTLSAARNLILDGRLRYHRQSLAVPAKLSCGYKEVVEADVINLSQGGVGVRVGERLPVASPVRLSFAIPGARRAVKCMGKVAWTDDHGNAGIRFVQISQQVKRDLQIWLEQQYFLDR